MTTSVTVKPANYPVKITTIDTWKDADGKIQTRESVEYLVAGRSYTYYCTTSRTISVVDVEYDEVEGSREAAEAARNTGV